MLTQDEVIAVAVKELAKQGHVAIEYDITVEANPGNENELIVWFDLKGAFRIPGGKHAVIVDKRTRHAEFMAGE
ncbi:MAG: hypothetical protein A2504_16475 [Bdellovibrionales bacterium RIFOXYD12_FULL_39_22]|nr:MAG: hypothetical protein A2385_10130 [Bdellovibrionales bacterium RIFOXYB1_FULL_39_21]OFZ45454.1 MAG: hypothetical protein A2404_01370 [Bdellovibrionales bacterium RIFOXYC1_FULL_39_130]OFZ74659.1 MAG: hypothetical protein A2560_09700 [Bdellovibrionales bacterium RIFOXYD1_FULL_39_84]OFZ92968.1 MAG: hypothetical protein A2504_16475 [Bdellovibrionales bacterium RIFOXYD12_FULL_39_22]